MLHHLFTSKARVKLLTIFLMNPDEEYYVRELTRLLDEQINAVRRELENLKKLGLLRSRTRNRKKYFVVNKNFVLFGDLKNIISKALNTHTDFIRKIQKLGNIDFLVLSGSFIGKDSSVDLLMVGKFDRDELSDFLDRETDFETPIKFTGMTKEDFIYRIKCNDRFLHDVLKDSENIIAINKLERHID
ncbi:hypothetical protein KKG71_03485 [Patescibacteria group bacterium]|nr:hypothetical protein [Patescibacteria group bacterium]